MRAKNRGFTLIELSIVLVVIGLLIGGVLAGQHLILTAGVRSELTQVEKFQAAVATFRGKYNYLPGDIPDPDATSFGFQPRGKYAGEGDGNGLIQGVNIDWSGANYGFDYSAGETLAFWTDLSTAHLIEGTFIGSTHTPIATDVTGAGISNYLPPAAIGNGNYIYVWSGGFTGTWIVGGDQTNYFGLSAVTTLSASNNGTGHGILSSSTLTVAQANAIDQKIDDGYPMSGKVKAIYLNWHPTWSGGGADSYVAAPGSTATCYDNSSDPSGTPGITNAVPHYSMEISSGSFGNCGLSFKFNN